MTSKRSIKSMKSVKIDEEGDYGSISAMGSITGVVPFTADEIKANGTLRIIRVAEIQECRVNGSFKAEEQVTLGTATINGSTKAVSLTVGSKARFNGSTTIERSVEGSEDTSLVFNGSLTSPVIRNVGNLTVNGKSRVARFENLGSLTGNGSVEAELIEVRGKVTLEVGSSESTIGLIQAADVEVGHNLNGTRTSMFGRSPPGQASIDEIRATGKVELDHVRVKKVVARELFVGEDTEVGEFVELT